MGQTPQELANSFSFTRELAEALARSDLFISELVRTLSDKEVLAKTMEKFANYGLYPLIVDTVRQVVAPVLIEYINSLPDDKRISLIAGAVGYHMANILASHMKDHVKPLIVELVKDPVFVKTFATGVVNYATQSKLFRERLLTLVENVLANEFRAAVADAVRANWEEMAKMIKTAVKEVAGDVAKKAAYEIGEKIVRELKKDEALVDEIAKRASEALLNDAEFVDRVVSNAKSELTYKTVRTVVQKLTDELTNRITSKILQDEEFVSQLTEKAKEELAKRVRRIA